MTSPRVSALVPAYNRAKYIREAIESALAQTFDDLEVVVVDDGSTDNTAEVVRGIDDPRVRYLHQPNGGVSAALNTACRAAHGEFVAMLGSDDAWLAHQVETLLDVITQQPDASLAYGRAQAMDAAGRPLPQMLGVSLKYPGRELASLLYGDCVCGLACLIRKDALERAGGFDERLIANEDWDLWIRMAEFSHFAFRDEILARYRMHPQSLTGAGSAQYRRVVLGRVKLIEDYYGRADVPAEAKAVKALALRNVYMEVGVRFIAVGRWQEGLPYLAKAVKVSGNPVAATARVTGVSVFDLYLSKTKWGVQLVDALVEWRRKRTAA